VRVRLKTLKPKKTLPPPVTLGEHLKHRRLALALRQKDAGQMLGVSAGTVMEWEKGIKTPSIWQYPAIFAFLGYDPFPQPSTIAERLYAKRRALGWSQRKTAGALNVDATSIMEWEAGGIILHHEHRKRVARFLELAEAEVTGAMHRISGRHPR
jgi:transcriptional regulator with XRE-family HTH domain